MDGVMLISGAMERHAWPLKPARYSLGNLNMIEKGARAPLHRAHHVQGYSPPVGSKSLSRTGSGSSPRDYD